MSVGMVILFAVFTALWILGLIDQFHSETSIMRYLVFSLGVAAVGVYRYTRHKKN